MSASLRQSIEDARLVASLFLPAPNPSIRSERSRIIAESFGLKADPAAPAVPFVAGMDLSPLVPQAGRIVLIIGASGAGKSSLLATIRAHQKNTIDFIDLAAMRLRDRPVVDLFGRTKLTDVLELLSRVGLAEVWTYLRTPPELSEGQRWRLRVAKALHRAMRERRRDPRSARRVLVCDEFAALLDRVSAAVVARTLRRAVDYAGLAAIVATSHEDLVRALSPDTIVRCDFGEVQIHRIEKEDTR